MSTPSDLLRKANTAQYVLNPSVSGTPIKNPAYYMQPPRANASMWMPEPTRTLTGWPARTDAPAYAHPTQPEQNPPTYAQQPTIAQPPVYPHQQSATWSHNAQPMPPAAPNWSHAPQQVPKPPTQPTPEFSAPMVEKNDMRVSVQPPNIPAPIIPQREPTIYRQLMEKHDRAIGTNRARK